MDVVNIRFLWKDDHSRTGNCPSLSRAQASDGRDGYLVVGKCVSDEVRAKTPEVADDEVVVWVPENVIDRVKALV